jgi:formylglycine-generating enzyme required for sulfatase activity
MVLGVVVVVFGVLWVFHPSSQVPAGQSGDKTLTNSIGMKFAFIPAGSFVMGSPETEKDRGSDEGPQHPVVLSKPFYLDKNEVTQEQYEKVMGSNPSFFSATGGGKQRVSGTSTASHPVENVSWNQAVEFCKKLDALPEEKAKGRAYRLPTEAEWEYACRAGTTAPFHHGAEVDSYAFNFNGLAPYGTTGNGPFFRRTRSVGEYKPNGFGLFDMHGNVQEWCADWYAADYYKASPKQDPQGPAEGTQRVLRGGAWVHSAKACRSAVRNKLPPEQAAYSTGFRVVLVAK